MTDGKRRVWVLVDDSQPHEGPIVYASKTDAVAAYEQSKRALARASGVAERDGHERVSATRREWSLGVTMRVRLFERFIREGQ